MSNKQSIVPPLWPLRFLRWFCDPALLEDVEGDLLELFKLRARKNIAMARLLFYRDVILLFRPGLIRNFEWFKTQNTTSMILNHLKTAVRHSLRYKGYTAINLLGLSVGLAATLLILLWVQDEVKKNRFHSNSERLYKVWRNMYQANGEVITTDNIPLPLEQVLRTEYPELDELTLLSWEMNYLFRMDDQVSYERGRYASPGFFRIFSFPLIIGSKDAALDDPLSIVISDELAAKYFGAGWKTGTIGKTFRIDEKKDFIITGVFEKPGRSSSVTFDWILPAQEYIQQNEWMNSWYNGGFNIFFTLKQEAELPAVQERILHEINKHTNNEADERIYLQKFVDSYLYSDFENGLPAGGRIEYVRIFSIIAAFILLISCINFMNLATARASIRSKEIGIKKVLGAQQANLRQQFFVESYLLSISAVMVSLLLVYLVLPFFNDLTGKSLLIDLTDPALWIGLLALTLLTGFFSGSYPAILLPSFKIIHSLKGKVNNASSGAYFRNGLVVFQFTLSFLLIIGSLVVSDQLSYILQKNLGLDKENLAYVYMEGDLAQRGDVYKTELLKIPEVKGVTLTSGNPLSYGRSTGSASWDGKNADEEVEINVLNVDEDFFRTMDIRVLKGRSFSKEFATDTANYIINEVLADIMGFDDPVGKNLSVWGIEGKVIGVAKDFHMSSLYDPIDPLIIRYAPSSTYFAFIRTQQNTQAALRGIEEVTKELNPAYPFDYQFLDVFYERSYKSEMALGRLMNIFTIVSVLISCLGLLGLSSFSAAQRSREIGIRKVHGASVARLVMLLSRDYSRLMLAAFLIASPLAFYVMERWLSNFTFRTSISLTLFAIAGLIIFLVGSLTVGFKSYQAATVNPVKSLKEE